MMVREAGDGIATAVLLGLDFGHLWFYPRNFYKICFNKVSELSEQQIRDIAICLNLSTVGVCMGAEVP